MIAALNKLDAETVSETTNIHSYHYNIVTDCYSIKNRYPVIKYTQPQKIKLLKVK